MIMLAQATNLAFKFHLNDYDLDILMPTLCLSKSESNIQGLNRFLNNSNA